MLYNREWCYEHKESQCLHGQQVGFEDANEGKVD
jgi:hypothetical protein